MVTVHFFYIVAEEMTRQVRTHRELIKISACPRLSLQKWIENHVWRGVFHLKLLRITQLPSGILIQYRSLELFHNQKFTQGAAL